MWRRATHDLCTLPCTPLHNRVASLESRQKELAAQCAQAISSASAVPALESTINKQLPALEAQIRTVDLAQKTLTAKVRELLLARSAVRW